VIAEPISSYSGRTPRPTRFADWRARLDRERVAPVIAMAGSKGKTSVLRTVETILRTAGYRFASWTNHGVEIEGERQRGELGPWSRALMRLAAGGLDIALQELDWATVQTAGAPGAKYPIVAVGNLCANSETCFLAPDALQARRALQLIKSSVAPAGRLVLNADDFALSEEGDGGPGPEGRYLVGISMEAPILRRHLVQGGDACWLQQGSITIRENGKTQSIADVRQLPWTREGTIPFAVQNALMATAIARSCGIPGALIEAGLMAHGAQPESMPGSFNVFEVDSAAIVVDRPMPSWFLRNSLRACANLGPGRQIRVVGPMTDVSTDDLSEVGRLLGRNGGVLIAYGGWAADRLELLRQGAAGNTVPPIFLQAPGERAAVQQALNMIRAKDVVLVLAEDPLATVNLIQRYIRRSSSKSQNDSRAANAS
jgi:cyanophycin synthetase